MMNLENNITLKIKYHSQNKNRIVEYIQNYNSVVKYTYNRLLENNNFKTKNEKLLDMCLSSIEISRRGYEWNHQYILKDKNKEKNIIFNDNEYSHSKINQSLEELNYSTEYSNIKDLYYKIKNSKTRYRVSFDELTKSRVFSKIHIKSYQTLYKFI